MLTASTLVEGSSRYLNTTLPTPSGSFTRAKTVADWPGAGSNGWWVTSVIAGPALALAREFAAPGVPSAVVVSMLPDASSQLPRRRNRISGCPTSHRTRARNVADWPDENAAVRGV